MVSEEVYADHEMQNIINDFQNIKSVKEYDEDECKEITVFLSFDISDSTKLKYTNPNEWAKIIGVLLNNVERFPNMDFWKFNGDEVLFKVKIYTIKFLCSIIKSAYVHLGSMQDIINQILPNVSLKGTIWLAITTNKLDKYSNNYRFILKDEIDFSGKNIDEGFRLTKYSSMKKIAVDPKIVYILMHYFNKLDHKSIPLLIERELLTSIKDILDKIHFIGDVFCKGVWREKPYPIYWYYNLDTYNGIRYGEFLNGVHLWRKFFESMGETSIKIISKMEEMKQMFTQVGVFQEVEELINKFKLFDEPDRFRTGKANLYFMVACINPVTGNVLIAQRSKKRKHLKGVWDFGNVKYQNIALEEIIISTYNKLFGIDIELIKDPNRGDNLKPFGFCTIYRNKLPHNGIMCYAFIKNEKNLSDDQLLKQILLKINNIDVEQSKYQNVKFISEHDIVNKVVKFNELTLDEIMDDSQTAPKNKDYTDQNTSIMHFEASIKGAYQEWLKKYR